MKPLGMQTAGMWAVDWHNLLVGACVALVIVPSARAQAAARARDQPAAVAAATATTQANNALVLHLVQTALIAVQQANITGNYTVLRDLAAPGFRDKNSAADLAEIFAPIRRQNIDLSQVLSTTPEITRAALDNQNMLFVAGKLRMTPVAVKFEILFQPVAGTWRIFGVAVIPEPPAQGSVPSGR